MRIPIINEQDEVIGYKDDRDHDYNPVRDIARTSALWLINEFGEALISKRSITKRFHPGLWGASVTGRIEGDETYEATIIREAKEELEIDLENINPWYKEFVQEEHTFWVQHFFATIPKSTKFTLQTSEVDEVKWISLQNLEHWFNKSPSDFSPPFKYSIRVIKNHANKS